MKNKGILCILIKNRGDILYYLGVDGGGTRTTAVVADANGNIIAKADGKSINYNSIGLPRAKENMSEIIRWLLDACDIGWFHTAFIGMSAISERANEEETKAFAENIIPADKVIMDSDVYIALMGLDSSNECAVVISGTGSMAAGRTKDGTIIHTGGWGYILGDEGSSYHIALDALKAAIRGYEKSAPETKLTKIVKDYFNIDDYLELIDIFYNPPMERSAIAKLTPKVFECAENGDEVSNQILLENAKQLAKTTSALLINLPLCKTLGTWGGVFEHNERYLNMFKEYIKADFPNIEVGLLVNPPVIGAVLAAIREGRTNE